MLGICLVVMLQSEEHLMPREHMGGHEDAGLSDMPHPGVSEVVPAPRTGRGLCSPAFRHCAGTV